MLVLQVLWFLAPPAVANLIPPVMARLLPAWNAPLDCGLRLRGMPLLGSHKTWRGLWSGTLAGAGVYWLQVQLVAGLPPLAALAPHPQFHGLWWLGAWLGLAALAGDALKSLVKRQLGIRPGRPWIPWDQVDWVLGILLASWPLFRFSLPFMLLCLLLGLVLSLSGKVIGYWLRINSHWI
ncbi:MAG: hypothetical protein RLZZ385_1610 [Pseudomonadota bacterium]|jgi:CDP-2,3-bis-(O-geranylgeranyl)-sn-glycerol synthase